LGFSDFHPDTWNPTWCVGTILTGLLSFMVSYYEYMIIRLSKPILNPSQLESTPTLGSIESSNYDKQMFAQKSLAFNLRNTNFCELFPEIVEEIKQRLRGTQAAAAVDGPAANGVKRSNGLANGASLASADGNLAVGGLANPLNAADAIDGGAAGQADLASGGGAAVQNSARNSYLNWQSVYSNLVIIICFAIFALIVNYVIKNLNQE